MTNEYYEIRRQENGRAEIEVPHENGRITFVSPAKGPKGYVSIQEQIIREGLIAPTMAQTASLVYTANQNPKEPEFAQVLKTLDNRGFWAFTGNRYVKNKGVYIRDNPEIVSGRVVLEDELELQRKIRAGDKSVRFIPSGFKVREQTALELAKNPFVIGLAGEDGAEKLAELSRRYRINPYVHSFENGDEESNRFSALSGYDRVSDRLNVSGYVYYEGDGIWDGYALGVKK